MPLEFVNIHGQQISDKQIEARKDLAKREASRKKPVDTKPFHKGWRVTGIPPGALEQAREDHQRLVDAVASQGGKAVKPFDEQHWIQNHNGKSVRSKPYETKSAADDCAALAQKCGWTRVRVEVVS